MESLQLTNRTSPRNAHILQSVNKNKLIDEDSYKSADNSKTPLNITIKLESPITDKEIEHS